MPKAKLTARQMQAEQEPEAVGTRPTKRRKVDSPTRKAESLSAKMGPLLQEQKGKTGSDVFQQVSQAAFVNQYKIREMAPTGDVYYQADFIPKDTADAWYSQLQSLDTYQPTLKMYGRSFPQSRHIAAYSTAPNATLNYSGTSVIMHHPFPPVLASMQGMLEERLGVRFNHCMLNRYDDGTVYIGKHSDNLNNLVIASISLGAERTFIMSPRLPSKNARGRSKLAKADKGEVEVDMGDLDKRESHKWRLANGSLVVMQGATQEYWKHEIPKEPKVKEGRISLTFRQLV